MYKLTDCQTSNRMTKTEDKYLCIELDPCMTRLYLHAYPALKQTKFIFSEQEVTIHWYPRASDMYTQLWVSGISVIFEESDQFSYGSFFLSAIVIKSFGFNKSVMSNQNFPGYIVPAVVVKKCFHVFSEIVLIHA